MRFSTLKYYLSEALAGMRRNRWMTVASIAVVAACFFIVAFSVCVMQNLQYMLVQIEDSVGVVAFLEDDVTSDDVVRIGQEINALPHVTLATYVSPEEALEELKEEWNADDILSGFDGDNNPLSHSFQVEMDDIANQGQVVAELEQVQGVRKINHAQTETDILLKVNKVVTIVGGLAILVLALIAVVIIMNTIKLSVFTRRYEINIMKFVGATDWFIRWPFLIEGLLIGLVGAAIPMAVGWLVYDQALAAMTNAFPAIVNIVNFLYAVDIFGWLVPCSLVGGMVLGIIGSVSSIRKHLKV